MKKQTLALKDIYTVGDLKGCTVKQAIDHNPRQIRKNHDNAKAVLDWPAIKYLVATELRHT